MRSVGRLLRATRLRVSTRQTADTEVAGLRAAHRTPRVWTRHDRRLADIRMFSAKRFGRCVSGRCVPQSLRLAATSPWDAEVDELAAALEAHARLDGPFDLDAVR